MLHTSVPTPGTTPRNKLLKEQINTAKVQHQLERMKQQSELHFNWSMSSDGHMQHYLTLRYSHTANWVSHTISHSSYVVTHPIYAILP